MNVGFIGLGRMGQGMARRILSGGGFGGFFWHERDQFNLGKFSARLGRHHHFIKLDRARIGASCVEERLQGFGVFGFKRGFVFVSERFVLIGTAGAKRCRGNQRKKED